VQWFRPIPDQHLRGVLAATLRAPGSPVRPPWPATGEAALAVSGLGMIAGLRAETPAPIASIAKMMTAYLVLTDHPLTVGGTGPALTVSPADVAVYRADLAAQQSVAAVAAGETLDEAAALQALLIPSANNIATLLAAWDAGSVPAFVAKMNATAARLGMTHTRYTDPSGLAPTTVSTAADQLVLAQAVMRIPEFAAIVAEGQVTLPVAGTVYNFDYEVGHDGFVGVKTGSDAAAGGCWVFAAKRTIAGRSRMVYGVVLGQHGAGGQLIQPALDAGRKLADAAPRLLVEETVLPAGTVVGYLRAAWRSPIAVRTVRAVTGLVAPGELFRARLTLRSPRLTAVAGGSRLGRLVLSPVAGPGLLGASYVALAANAPGPAPGWRLTRL
jgi:D-alanyl-D-alanine carboxypeptidase (penicillin-binding protein 5/6)